MSVKASPPVASSLAIRCGSCHAAICVPHKPCSGEELVQVTCGTCSKTHALNPEHELLRSESVREGLRELALANRIDLPGAYSVRLGILGLDEIRDLGHPEVRPIPGRLLVAPSGGFLMNRLDLSSLPRAPNEEFKEVWDLFGPDGKITGRLTTDRSISLRVLKDEFLYAISRDEFDVQYVVRFRADGVEG